MRQVHHRLALLALALLLLPTLGAKVAFLRGGATAQDSYFCDDFTADAITNWTQDTGVWSTTTTDNVLMSNVTGVVTNDIRYTAAIANSPDQFAYFRIPHTAYYHGIIFRAQTSGPPFYVVANNDNVISWFVVDAGGIQTLVATSTFNSTVVSGDWIGARITGTGSGGTTVVAYHWAIVQGDPGHSIAAWPTNDVVTFTNPAIVNPVDAGSYIGIRNWEATNQFDDFCGGDQSDAP